MSRSTNALKWHTNAFKWDRYLIWNNETCPSCEIMLKLGQNRSVYFFSAQDNFLVAIDSIDFYFSTCERKNSSVGWKQQCTRLGQRGVTLVESRGLFLEGWAAASPTSSTSLLPRCAPPLYDAPKLRTRATHIRLPHYFGSRLGKER